MIPMLDDGNLSPEKAQELIDIVKEREVDLRSDQKEIGVEYFEDRKQSLIKFLQRSVDSGEPIECSL